jgi:signal transduction histidine kinase
VAIDIIDNGPGIPEFARARVFERFYRLDQARWRKEGGFGLGLAIAHWAVELNGGTIGFHDKEGSGTWCRIVLPGE